MIRHETMDSLSPLWWLCILATLASIVLIITLPRYYNWAKSKYYQWSIGFLMISNMFIENVYAFQSGQWHFQDNLPLHLCGISGIMGIMLMFRFNAAIAQVFFYWALTGGIHSLLTPEFDLGMNGYFFYSYFINHGSLLLVSFYIIKHFEFTPEKGSWIKAFCYLQIPALAIGVFNWLTGANYMYLSAPPIVENPLIVGKWPFYIIVFEILALVHFFVIYSLYQLFKKYKEEKITLAAH